MQVTGGPSWLSWERRSRKGSKQFFLVQAADILGGVFIGRRETIGNGFELEGRQIIKGVGATGLDQALMVKLRVDESNM